MKRILQTVLAAVLVVSIVKSIRNLIEDRNREPKEEQTRAQILAEIFKDHGIDATVLSESKIWFDCSDDALKEKLVPIAKDYSSESGMAIGGFNVQDGTLEIL